ncbi:MAG: choice-of-anchor D domain-containing protein [Microscillaceae bacterium]|nr:choice-of-anchor D domain-containing protein [Microscillaceae bacterium]
MKNSIISFLILIHVFMLFHQVFYNIESINVSGSCRSENTISNILIHFEKIKSGSKIDNSILYIPKNNINNPFYTLHNNLSPFVTKSNLVKEEFEPRIIIKNPNGEEGKSFNFGSIKLDSSVNGVFTIENRGTIDLNITEMGFVDSTGAFSLVTKDITPIAPNGGSATFTITFNPTSPGNHKAIFELKSNAPNSPVCSIMLSGFGERVFFPEIELIDHKSRNIASGGTVHIDNVSIGDSIEYTFTIENTGQGELFLTGDTLVKILGENADEFGLKDPPDQQISPLTGNTSFQILFAPQSEGVKQISVSIPNDDTDESPFTFFIKGTGINSCKDNIQMPDAFTPHSSKTINDSYCAVIEGKIVSFEMKIFNRSNQQVFQSTEVMPCWDGMCEGKKAPSGPYVYKIKYKCQENNSPISLTGSLLLLNLE